jgi:hypothetical protein
MFKDSLIRHCTERNYKAHIPLDKSSRNNKCQGQGRFLVK